MSGVGKTEAISVHWFRHTARREERRLQAILAIAERGGRAYPSGLPEWARGVRVERAGKFCHAVIATEERGH